VDRQVTNASTKLRIRSIERVKPLGLKRSPPKPMSFLTRLTRLRTWIAARRSRPLSELLSVEFDEEEVRVIVLDRFEATWNQSFRWSDIVRVCFQDAGIFASDILFIELTGRINPAVVLTEAKGGSAFFGALCGRGFLPEDVWRKAISETGGATHCWPPGQTGG
jgi:hypothetical protein